MNTDRLSHTSMVRKNEMWLALKNGLKLLTSLLITLSIAFFIRFWMPKFLGPENFGMLYFSEEFAFTFFALATLGANTYIQKEVAIRKEHASEFFGSLFLIRAIIAMVLVGIMFITLSAMSKDPVVFRMVALFAAGQLFMVNNFTLGAMLESNRSINELAIVNSVSKIFWGGGIVVGLAVFGRMELVALVFFLTELFKAPVLYAACRKHLSLRWVLDFSAGKAMIIAAFPYFLNFLSHQIYAKIDVMMISSLSNDKEVGWYGAAANCNNFVLLVLPVLTAVVMPMTARIAQQSEEALNQTMRSAIRFAMMLSLPLTFIVALNAEFLVRLLFGEAYLPSINSLRILSVIAPLTFLCVLLSIHLMQLNRIWKVAKISLVGLALNPLMNGILIIPVHRYMGDGGAGFAAGCTSVLTELVTAILMVIAADKAAYDRKTGLLLLRFSMVAVLMIAADQLLQAYVSGLQRLIGESVLYVIVAVTFRVLPLKDAMIRAKAVLAERRNRKKQ